MGGHVVGHDRLVDLRDPEVVEAGARSRRRRGGAARWSSAGPYPPVACSSARRDSMKQQSRRADRLRPAAPRGRSSAPAKAVEFQASPRTSWSQGPTYSVRLGVVGVARRGAEVGSPRRPPSSPSSVATSKCSGQRRIGAGVEAPWRSTRARSADRRRARTSRRARPRASASIGTGLPGAGAPATPSSSRRPAGRRRRRGAPRRSRPGPDPCPRRATDPGSPLGDAAVPVDRAEAAGREARGRSRCPSRARASA